jgi:exodeoxyribonuclease VII large subunit
MSVQPDLFSAREPTVYGVRAINEIVRRLLDDAFGEVTVEGEISNARRQPGSGHWYFTLKEQDAQLAAVLFRGDAEALRFQPENGLAVRATGKLTIWVQGGRYQLQVRRLAPVGQGALELAFRQLCAKLQAEGLFDPGRKRPLPRFPRRVALVTSPAGAAVRDMLTTLAARWPLARVLVVPVAVQGDAAPGEIVQALRLVDRARAADVILLARGGGSLEDLWAFNDERVARAIAAAGLPVVTGIGHETDTTIADLVADRRAPTPTAAAAAVVPHRDEIHAALQQAAQRLPRALRRQLELPRQRLLALERSHGMRRIRGLVAENAQALDVRLERLERGARSNLERRAARLAQASAALQALSPARVLDRGYAYCTDGASGAVVQRAAATRPGRDLVVHWSDGAHRTRVLDANGM